MARARFGMGQGTDDRYITHNVLPGHCIQEKSRCACIWNAEDIQRRAGHVVICIVKGPTYRSLVICSLDAGKRNFKTIYCALYAN